MSFDLQPLILDLGKAAGPEWQALAMQRASTLQQGNLVWPRFVVHLLTELLDYYPVERSGLPQLFLVSIRDYYQRSIAAKEFPTEQEWANPSPRQWNRLRREDTLRRMFSMGELLTGMAVANRFRDQHLMAVEAVRATTQIFVHRQVFQSVMAHRYANDLSRQAEQTISARQRLRLQRQAEHAWRQEQASRRRLAELREHFKTKLALQLLVQIQLEQPPRTPTEAGLQKEILQDFSLLPIYCDWLEEEADRVSAWLRRL